MLRKNNTYHIVYYTLITFFLFLLLSPDSLFAQSGTGSAQPGIDLKSLTEISTNASQSDLRSDDKFATDDIINPDYYMMGPGDILSVMIFPVPAVEQPIIISPECTAIIPRIGVVSLKGKTLTQAKDTITQIVKKRNSNSSVSLTLRKARLVYVTISGNVMFPGVFAFPASTHVSTLVKIAHQQAPTGSNAVNAKRNDKQEENGSTLAGRLLSRPSPIGLTSFSSRNIKIYHRNGTSSVADLEKARYNPDGNDDPMIREGDEVYVPFAPITYQTISISGAVRRPVVLAYKEGDKASFLFKAAMGITENADINAITGISNNSSTLSYSLNERNELENDHPLTPGYAINVGTKKNETRAATGGFVEIVGEVQNPGTFSIIPEQTKLRDIIQQAGGFTPDAYLPLGYVLQQEAEPFDSKKIEGRNILRGSDLLTEDTARFLMHNERKLPIASCDLSRCFDKNNPSDKDNIVLNSGDIIVIPKNPKKIFVYGQVVQPGYIAFEPGKNAEWYLNSAGGLSAGAIKSMIRIIKGKSKVWIEPESTTVLEAGDAIYVPPPPLNPAGYEVQYYATVANFAATALILVTTVLALFRN